MVYNKKVHIREARQPPLYGHNFLFINRVAAQLTL